MSLLPSSKPDVESEQEGELRLLGLDDEDTDAVLEAISSETARSILASIHEEARTASELASQMDTSLQNVSYHLENLEEAGLIRVAGTQYSEKGTEMQVYAPADEPLVMFVGTEERKRSFTGMLSRFIGATALLAVVSVVLHAVIRGGLPYLDFTGAGAAGGGAGGEPGLPLATAVFLGGVVVLVVGFVWWHWRREIHRIVARVEASPLLGGRHDAVTRRGVLAGAVAFAATAALWYVVSTLDVRISGVGPLDPAPVSVLVLVGAAAVQAYYNDGLLVSWLLVFGPVAGFALGLTTAGIEGQPAAIAAGVIGYSVILGTTAALVLGTGGFLLGAGGRRLLAWLPERVP